MPLKNHHDVTYLFNLGQETTHKMKQLLALLQTPMKKFPLLSLRS